MKRPADWSRRPLVPPTRLRLMEMKHWYLLGNEQPDVISAYEHFTSKDDLQNEQKSKLELLRNPLLFGEVTKLICIFNFTSLWGIFQASSWDFMTPWQHDSKDVLPKITWYIERNTKWGLVKRKENGTRRFEFLFRSLTSWWFKAKQNHKATVENNISKRYLFSPH